MKSVHGNHPLLESHQITKDFGHDKGAFDISLTLLPGKVIGFVGPNGAGKSTTINMLTGLIKPTRGKINLFGETYSHTTIYRVMPRIGVMYSESTLDESLTPKQVFQTSQALLGKDCSAQWGFMSDQLELDVDKRIKKLSLGNKKKVGVIHALMHEPELIIMDEPTSGLDPIIRDRFGALVRQTAERGAGVLLSSHDLGEVQEISDEIVMIKDGRIVMTDQTDAILNKAERLFRLVNPPQKLISKLRETSFISQGQKSGSDYTFHTNQYGEAIKLIAGTEFYNFFIERPSLEETFKEYYE